MALMLGIDTGGTYTDAAIIDDTPGARPQATAKAPTTHGNLAEGVAAAVSAVLADGGVAAEEIALVSVSTTLATNALVEGHGEPAALFAFGFSQTELARTGLFDALAPNHVVLIDGGHDAHGYERVPLDVAALGEHTTRLEPEVTAFAVAGQFSVRNATHEHAAVEHLRSITSKPVTSSHALSARLDGPRRALTAALNARLIGTIARLNRAVKAVLQAEKIDAPLMVVRGDGSLVSAEFAEQRPIETVLSGPAASVTGALHLGTQRDGLVVDIGGTTTDVAVIRDGRPAIADRGAVVGGHRTMVEAVDMATAGIGGDSEVRIDSRADDGPVLLGPERAIPLGRLALDFPDIHDLLDRQLAAPLGLGSHGRFLLSEATNATVSDEREQRVLDRLADGPAAAADLASSGLALRALERLRSRGVVRVATMTPTDATAVLTSTGPVDRSASVKAAALLARQTGPHGSIVAADGEALAVRVIELIERRSADFVLRTALAGDGIRLKAGDVELVDAALDRHRGAAIVNLGLGAPLTAIGAPAATYYPAIADRLGVTAVVPPHAEVANAIGAVVGQVRIRRAATVTQPTKGQYRVHVDDQPTFGSVERARNGAEAILREAAIAEALAAGAATPEVTTRWSQRTANVDGREVFVEGTLTVEAAGRPRF